jgi:hypothetical protein
MVNEEKEGGVHTVEYSSADLVSGVYIYGMQAGQYVDAKKKPGCSPGPLDDYASLESGNSDLLNRLVQLPE